MYLDASKTFHAEVIVNIVNGCKVEHLEFTNRIIVQKIYSIEQLMGSLKILIRLMTEKKYSLLIVDSASLLYDNEYQLEYERRTYFATFVQMLVEFAKTVRHIAY